jgi:hypothetical protein
MHLYHTCKFYLGLLDVEIPSSLQRYKVIADSIG